MRNPADTYEEFNVAYMFRPWTEELLARATPQRGERILDVACATGIVARMTAQRLAGAASVVGVDPNPEMLAVAQAAVVREGFIITWVEGRAEDLPFPDASFDLVLVQQGLQYFNDKTKAMAELSRILAPGGRLVSSTWATMEQCPFFDAFNRTTQRHLGTTGTPTPYALGDPEQLRLLHAEAGFVGVIVEVVRRDVCFPSADQLVELNVVGSAAVVPELQRLNAAERAALIEAIRSDMAAPIQQFTEQDALVCPMVSHIVIAHKNH